MNTMEHVGTEQGTHQSEIKVETRLEMILRLQNEAKADLLDAVQPMRTKIILAQDKIKVKRAEILKLQTETETLNQEIIAAQALMSPYENDAKMLDVDLSFGANVAPAVREKGSRACSRCSQSGHNAATCKAKVTVVA